MVEFNEKVRYCKECKKKLSGYNKGDVCFYHQTELVQYEYLPVTVCTSYSRQRQHDREETYIYPRPGMDNYNEFAFMKVEKNIK